MILMKTFKVNKPKTQTYKPSGIKSLTDFNGVLNAGVNGKVLTKIPVKDISVRPQVRTVIENIEELAESMKTGQLMPISVTKNDDGKYTVLQGERRWLAAQKAGLEFIEAIVVDAPASEPDRIFGQLTENIQRDNMKLQDLISSIDDLVKAGFSQTQIAARLGKDRTYISRIAALASAHAEVLELVSNSSVNDAQTAQILNNICELSKDIKKDLASCKGKDGIISRGNALAVLERLQAKKIQKVKKVVALEDRLKKKDIPGGFHKVSAAKPLNIAVEYEDENGNKCFGSLLPRLLSDQPGKVCILSADGKSVLSLPTDRIKLKTINELA